MTVLYDFKSELIVSTSAAVSSFTHTATIANVMGVAVGFAHGNTSLDTITNVSYGGTNLVRIIQAEDSATEPGVVEWWVSPTIPLSGQRTVHYSSGVPASNMFVVAITFTGAGHVYALSSQIEAENTTSHSVSLTTGYVSGYGLGALHWGGASPFSISYGVSPTVMQAGAWDMGAFGAVVMRTINATAAGSGPLLDFGAQQPGTDDIAFAAIFVTDGGINPGVGLATMAGLAPTVVDQSPSEAITAPGVGLVSTVGQIPVVEGDVFPGVGLVSTVGQIPVVEGDVFPGVGSVVTVGQIPDEYRELNQNIGLGSAAIGGHAPECGGENYIGCGAGLGIMEGRQPDLYLERIIEPGVGTAILEGRLPTVVGDSGAPGVEATALPGVGLVTLDGQLPTLAVEYDKPRGHVKGRRSRYYGPEYVELSNSLEPVVSLTAPQPFITEVVADFRPDEVLKIDTSGTEYRISQIEARRALIAKRRREEEDLMAILMRAA